MHARDVLQAACQGEIAWKQRQEGIRTLCCSADAVALYFKKAVAVGFVLSLSCDYRAACVERAWWADWVQACAGVESCATRYFKVSGKFSCKGITNNVSARNFVHRCSCESAAKFQADIFKNELRKTWATIPLLYQYTFKLMFFVREYWKAQYLWRYCRALGRCI